MNQPLQPDPQISVVIAARNAQHTIEDQLNALRGQSFSGRWELIVADNGSTDFTFERVGRWRDQFHRLTIVDASGSLGAYSARNAGTLAARASRIAYCDADDIVTEDWLEALYSGLEESPMVTGPVELETLNPANVVGLRARTFWEHPPDWHGFLPSAMTSNLAIHREVFDALDGFQLIASGSDFRFVWLAQLRGWELGYAAEALVHRREPVSWYAYLKRSYRYGSQQPQLFKEFRSAGMRRSSLRTAASYWVALAAGLPTLVTSCGRYAWLDTAGLRAGRAVGSVRARVLYL
jgi:glycosyltransferase involved in cell wall biosynthesis